MNLKASFSAVGRFCSAIQLLVLWLGANAILRLDMDSRAFVGAAGKFLWWVWDPYEIVASGIRKYNRTNKPRRYLFASEIVGEMTPEHLAGRLSSYGVEKWGFYRVTKTEQGVVALERLGLSRYLVPQITFSEHGAQLVVPYDLQDDRDWDKIAQEIAKLFH